MCLPIGPERLALKFWKCLDCDCFYTEQFDHKRIKKRVVQMNKYCAALMTQFSKHTTKNLWRCYDCREKIRKENSFLSSR